MEASNREKEREREFLALTFSHALTHSLACSYSLTCLLLLLHLLLLTHLLGWLVGSDGWLVGMVGWLVHIRLPVNCSQVREM